MGILWRLTVTPLLIGLLTLVARRYGSRTAGLVMGLPLTSGPISLLLAIDQGAGFSARAADASLGAIAGVALFCGAYALMTRWFAWPGAVAGGTVAFCAGSGAFQWARLSSCAAALLSLATVTILAWAAAGMETSAPLVRSRVAASLEPAGGATSSPPPVWDLPARMAVSLAGLGLVTALAPSLGPRLSGALSSLPVLTAVMAVFTHRRGDERALLALLSGTVRGEIASVAFFGLVSLLSEHMGIPSTYLMATGSALLVNGAQHGTASHRVSEQGRARRQASP
jgi:hypothetical protein